LFAIVGAAVLVAGLAVGVTIDLTSHNSKGPSGTQSRIRSAKEAPSRQQTNPDESTLPESTTTSLPDTGPGTAITAVPLTGEGTSAMDVVQSLASALASQQWDQARSIFPLLGSDSELASAYGALNQSTVVVTSESGNGTSVTLTGAYVAWETVNGDARTSIYCIQWDVNPALQQVVNQVAVDSNTVGYQNQWVDPSSTVSFVMSQCSP
jgi:hypothetical protein